jgi:methylated-DNA-[protein]-cysteine S-methyltransferase
MTGVNEVHRDPAEAELEGRLRDAAAGFSGPEPSLVPAAQAAGLLDVVYAGVDSPLGRLLVAGTPAGLVRVSYLDARSAQPRGEDAVLAQLAQRISPRILRAPAQLDAARRELDEYFAGRRRSFDLRLDLRLIGPFARRVLAVTAAIPYGEVSSYARVAAAAGSPRGSRAAGNALGSNPLPIVLPCHRVLRSTGALGGYTGDIERKVALLELEAGQLSFGPTNRDALRGPDRGVLP